MCGGYNDTGTMKCVESLSFDSDCRHQCWNEEQSMNISRSALTSIVLSDLSKERLVQLLPRHRRKSKFGLETIPELDERIRSDIVLVAASIKFRVRFEARTINISNNEKTCSTKGHIILLQLNILINYQIHDFELK